MGMFDYIVCEYPLPGQTPPWPTHGLKFQTKETPAQSLEAYTIKPDGRLVGDEAENFTGTVVFYYTNSNGLWGDITYTPDGEDCVSATYEAVFVSGVLTNIRQTEFAVSPAVRSQDLEAEIQRRHQPFSHPDYSGPWEGRSIYLMYGTDKNPTRVTVLAENDRQISYRHEESSKFSKAGDLNTEHKSFGNCMFLSAEDAIADRQWRDSRYSIARAIFDEMTRGRPTPTPIA